MNFRYNSFLKSNFLKSFYRENSEIIFLNSSFCFKDSFSSEKFFKFCNFYNIYSRFSNPNLSKLENKISFFEGLKYCLTFSSGMSALFSIFVNFLIPNDYFCSSVNVFGSTLNFFLSFLFKFNIFVLFIDFLNYNSIFSNIFLIKLIFFESPSNPLIKLYNIKFISYISFKYNILFFIDNTFSTFILQPIYFYNISFVLYSCTKFFDGQGRILSGAVLTNNYFLYLNIFSFIRFSGFSSNPFNSWILFKSLDHLFIRIKSQIYNCYIFLKLFKYNFFLFKIFYSGFLNYNQYKIFIFQQIFSNSIFSFVVKGFNFEFQRLNCWKFVNNLFISNTSNLGDISTIVTNCSITTHNSLSFLEKYILNIFESLLRISFGLEDLLDIYYNFSFSFDIL